jgi:hypothetical protein
MNLRLALGSCALAFAAGASCGGGNHAAAGAGSSGGSAETATNSANTAEEGSGEHRRGLHLHLDNMHAGGDLPAAEDPPADRLDVTFDLQISHTGTEPVTGVQVSRARLVADEGGREIVFGLLSDAWDGRLEPGQQRTIQFRKSPDSAVPKPNRSFCGAWMRIEVTLDLAGRQARAYSRRVQIECPPATAH